MSAIVSFLAETPVHVGIGQSNAAIDLPFARESSTGFPHVPGSGMKGAFRVWSNGAGFDDGAKKDLFGVAADEDEGSDKGAGSILLGEARLALLPVRSVSHSYLYITCPTILRRLSQDVARAGVSLAFPKLDEIAEGKCLSESEIIGLEEREFQRQGYVPEGLSETLISLFPQRFSNEDELGNRIVILNDADFSWFAEFALQVVTRNSLDENKRVKTGALWSEELLPTDSLLWMFLGTRNGTLEKVRTAIVAEPYLQVGGNETIGQGWLHMQCLPLGAAI
ncbi:type III-B CRISPR module RAMP protein Cmr4 [Donghicola mangrovi]|uniref:Type III-B CRISPR module RAMP protein Cmr4 n=1 Tax=Donghicola mangrovi TaxID=2729614 RepID=A0A850Q2V4_9RHOB|nr:type III-B CRISPR module RAMP protein Cmr4 [Donghicola mangrovi]NVO23313.1 type III-B CRISPR module RAMP protein Cmr4 [Donghicola mangrovi]